MKIAILHDPQDGQVIATKLAQALAGDEHQIWVDRRSTPPDIDVSMVNEMAVKRADIIIVCLTPNCVEITSRMQHFSRLARLAEKPVLIWQAAQVPVPPTINYLDPLAAYVDWDQAVAQLKTQLGVAEYIEPTSPEPAENDPYFDILEPQRRQLETLLVRTVFNLQVWDTDFTSLGHVQAYPFSLSDGVTRGTFDDLWHKHNQQVMVTGSAASGKSTLLMGLAYQAILKRLSDPAALIPHYIQVYRWNGEDSLFQSVVGLDEAVLYVDGLNELRADLVDATTEMPLDLRVEAWREFLQVMPSETPVVLSGLPSDYLALSREFADLPAHLDIQPLDEAILKENLRDAQWGYVQAQSTLKDVIQQPLYLTLYRKLAEPTALELDGESVYETQDALIDAYIEERVSATDALQSLSTEELLEAVETVLWDLLTGSKRRDYVELWENHIQQSLGRQTRIVTDSLITLGLLIPIREGVARFIHPHVYRYFIFDNLAARFLDGFATEQQKAIQALTRYVEPEAQQILLAALQSDNINVVPFAAQALARLENPESVPLLLKMYGDWSDTTQTIIAQALAQFADKNSLKTFINALEVSNDNDEVRAIAAWALGRIGDQSAVSALQQAIQDEDWTVALNSIEALGKLKATEAVTDLIVLLDDIDDDIRRYAVQALSRIGDKRAVNILLNHLEDPDAKVRAELYRTLQKLGDVSAVELLIEALDDDDPIVCQSAASSLQELGADITPTLVTALVETDNEEIRYSLAQVLGQFGQPAVPNLIEIAHHENADVRSSVVQALGWIGGSTALTTLIGLLDNDSDLDVRIHATNAIGWVGDVTAIDSLIGHLDDGADDLVLSILQVLGELADETAIPYIEPLLDSPNELISRAADEIIMNLEAENGDDN